MALRELRPAAAAAPARGHVRPGLRPLRIRQRAARELQARHSRHRLDHPARPVRRGDQGDPGGADPGGPAGRPGADPGRSGQGFRRGHLPPLRWPHVRPELQGLARAVQPVGSLPAPGPRSGAAARGRLPQRSGVPPRAERAHPDHGGADLPGLRQRADGGGGAGVGQRHGQASCLGSAARASDGGADRGGPGPCDWSVAEIGPGGADDHR